jgi:riboflavin biosynthesis pyrimidine reductase
MADHTSPGHAPPHGPPEHTPAEHALTGGARGEPPAEIPPDPAEARLRALYPHRAGIVRLNLIASADGKAAGADGTSRGLGGPEDQRILTVLRALCDVVLVGAQTARRERYADLTLRPELAQARTMLGLREHVDVAVVTHTGNLPPGLTPARTWVVTHAGSPATARLGPEWAERLIIAGDQDVSPRTAIGQLGARGLSRVLCEGGPTLAGRLLNRGVVDDYCLTASPVVGAAAAPAIPPVPAGMDEAATLEGGGFVMRRWTRHS